jgi:hypothetical protein
VTKQAGVVTTLALLGEEECAELGLRGTLGVQLDDDGAGFVATLLVPPGIDAFGTGSSSRAAVEDLVEVMRAEASSLRARRDRLAPALAMELGILERVLIPEGTAPVRFYVGARFTAGAMGPAFNTATSRNSYIRASDSAELTA